jgi:hypothetical protein
MAEGEMNQDQINEKLVELAKVASEIKTADTTLSAMLETILNSPLVAHARAAVEGSKEASAPPPKAETRERR